MDLVIWAVKALVLLALAVLVLIWFVFSTRLVHQRYKQVRSSSGE